MRLEPINPEDYLTLYHLSVEAEGNGAEMDFRGWLTVMLSRLGWTVFDGDKIAGYVSVSDYVPGVDVTLHVTIAKEYHGRWLTRGMIRFVFNVIFTVFDTPRITGYAIKGLTGKAEQGLKALGFKREGCKRKAAKVHGKLRDFIIYGMLKEECRWIGKEE